MRNEEEAHFIAVMCAEQKKNYLFIKLKFDVTCLDHVTDFVKNKCDAFIQPTITHCRPQCGRSK